MISFSIFVAGWLLRIVSYITLGEFFMFKVGVKNNHELIESGPYKYLVHPSYTGGIIATIGIFMYFRVYYIMSIIIMILSLYGCHERCIIEEDIMREKFGDKYDNYLKKRWRIFPYIL